MASMNMQKLDDLSSASIWLGGRWLQSALALTLKSCTLLVQPPCLSPSFGTSRDPRGASSSRREETDEGGIIEVQGLAQAVDIGVGGWWVWLSASWWSSERRGGSRSRLPQHHRRGRGLLPYLDSPG